jgi:hypothetical protein
MKKQIILGIASALLTTSAAFAGSSSTFGALPGSATFGGTGINTTATEITTVTGLPSSDTLTLGLSASPFGPGAGNPLANNGNATFFTTPGVSPAKAGRATWNFDYYIGINNGTDLGNYTFKLLYTDGTTSGSFDPIAVANIDGGKSVTSTTREDSENIEFFGYDVTAPGVYNFDLQAFNGTTEVGDAAITVDVAPVPDATSTLPLLGAAVLGLAFLGRKVKATA